MQAVKSRNTAPELIVRQLVHRLGYRFRLHRTDLPGTPDLAFPGRLKALFVHGCFWHGHDCPRGARVPVQNREYWERKISRNRERDEYVLRALTKLGWRVAVLWECEIKDRAQTSRHIHLFLGEVA